MVSRMRNGKQTSCMKQIEVVKMDENMQGSQPLYKYIIAVLLLLAGGIVGFLMSFVVQIQGWTHALVALGAIIVLAIGGAKAILKS